MNHEIRSYKKEVYTLKIKRKRQDQIFSKEDKYNEEKKLKERRERKTYEIKTLSKLE